MESGRDARTIILAAPLHPAYSAAILRENTPSTINSADEAINGVWRNNKTADAGRAIESL
jgi:hypothetical protein